MTNSTEIKEEEKIVTEIKYNLKHHKIDSIIKALESRQRNSKNVMLSGPIGTGKTTLCSQISEKLGLNFYPYSLCSHTTKSDLVGFLDARGEYRASALRKAYEEGGLVLLDEMDAANPNILSIINNILSNNIFYFPDKMIQKNPEFRCVCAMNSNGRGNEIIYTKSQRLDASTLDRFVFIRIDIDTDLEKAVTNSDDWYSRVLKFRDVIKQVCGDEIVIGSRAMYDGADLLEAGFSQSEVEDMVIYKGIDEDIISQIKAKMDVKPENTGNYKPTSNSESGQTLVDGLIKITNSKGEEAWVDPEYNIEDGGRLVDNIKKAMGV